MPMRMASGEKWTLRQTRGEFHIWPKKNGAGDDGEEAKETVKELEFHGMNTRW